MNPQDSQEKAGSARAAKMAELLARAHAYAERRKAERIAKAPARTPSPVVTEAPVAPAVETRAEEPAPAVVALAGPLPAEPERVPPPIPTGKTVLPANTRRIVEAKSTAAVKEEKRRNREKMQVGRARNSPTEVDRYRREEGREDYNELRRAKYAADKGGEVRECVRAATPALAKERRREKVRQNVANLRASLSPEQKEEQRRKDRERKALARAKSTTGLSPTEQADIERQADEMAVLEAVVAAIPDTTPAN